jgi:hypothetical protein
MREGDQEEKQLFTISVIVSRFSSSCIECHGWLLGREGKPKSNKEARARSEAAFPSEEDRAMY